MKISTPTKKMEPGHINFGISFCKGRSCLPKNHLESGQFLHQFFMISKAAIFSNEHNSFCYKIVDNPFCSLMSN